MELVIYATRNKVCYFDEEDKFRAVNAKGSTPCAEDEEFICSLIRTEKASSKKGKYNYYTIGDVGLQMLGDRLYNCIGSRVVDPLLVKQACLATQEGTSFVKFANIYDTQKKFKQKFGKYKRGVIEVDDRSEYEKLIISISKPSVQRNDGYTEDLEAQKLEDELTFNTVRVNVLLSSSMSRETQCTLAKKYKRQIYDDVLTAISKDRHYKMYNVPVSVLKIERFNLLSDGSLDLFFIRRDIDD